MGCMRLSTERDRNAADGIAVLHAAFDAGITFFDTADAYCWDSSETGHNERLIATALDTWTGDRARIVIATKGGLTRPQGNWIEDGRARSLVSACEASCRALGVDLLLGIAPPIGKGQLRHRRQWGLGDLPDGGRSARRLCAA